MPFITIAGENQIAAKQGASLPVNIVNFVMANIAGLGSEPVDRIEAMPIAGDIVSTLPPTSSGYVNDNQVVYSLVMDSSIGDFDFNWIGLVDDEGVLIAVTYVPTISKTATAGEVPGNNLTRNFLLAYSGIAATAALAVPAETWQIDFNARLHGIDERERLSNFDIYGVQAFYGAAWQVVRQGVTDQYDILTGIGYVSGIRIDNAATQVITGIASTSVWLDVSLQGDISDVSPVVDFVNSAAAQADFTDGLGFDHYLVKIADISAGGVVTDLRVDADFMAVHLAEADPHPQYLTPAEGDAAYDPIGGIDAHEIDPDPHTQYELAFPSGTLMLFQQTAAPVGWTKETTHNNKALRVVSGAAGGGGSSPFTTVFGQSGTQGHTLDVTEIPAHQHTIPASVLSTGANGGGSRYYPSSTTNTSSVGGGGSHSHNMNIQVQYVDLIIASKD